MVDMERAFASAKKHLRSIYSAGHIIRKPLFVSPGHFYSPLTSAEDARRAKAKRSSPPAGIDLREDRQRELFESFDHSTPPAGRWKPSNDQFGPVDAMLYRAMLNRLRPRRVVEIGSGHSTALALDVAETSALDLELTCVEPYPARLNSVLRAGDVRALNLLPVPVQDISVSDLLSKLQPNDVFFIDSSHVLKSGSDVAWIYLHILPKVPKGVYVHVHDIHWPFEYMDSWLDERRDWTEIYMLHALLIENPHWEIELFGDWAMAHLPVDNKSLTNCRAGSFWMRRT